MFTHLMKILSKINLFFTSFVFFLLTPFYVLAEDTSKTTGSSSIDGMLEQLTAQGPLITLFVLVCIGMFLIIRDQNKKISKKEEEIKNINDSKEKELKELNEYIRENDKENMKILSDVNNTLDKVVSNQEHSDDKILKELDNLRDVLIMKIENIENKKRR